jgi:hypothetical protein
MTLEEHAAAISAAIAAAAGDGFILSDSREEEVTHLDLNEIEDDGLAVDSVAVCLHR